VHSRVDSRRTPRGVLLTHSLRLCLPFKPAVFLGKSSEGSGRPARATQPQENCITKQSTSEEAWTARAPGSHRFFSKMLGNFFSFGDYFRLRRFAGRRGELLRLFAPRTIRRFGW